MPLITFWLDSPGTYHRFWKWEERSLVQSKYHGKQKKIRYDSIFLFLKSVGWGCFKFSLCWFKKMVVARIGWRGGGQPPTPDATCWDKECLYIYGQKGWNQFWKENQLNMFCHTWKKKKYFRFLRKKSLLSLYKPNLRPGKILRTGQFWGQK